MPELERERIYDLRQRLAINLHLLVGVAGVVEMGQREVADARTFEVGKLFDVVGHQVDDIFVLDKFAAGDCRCRGFGKRIDPVLYRLRLFLRRPEDRDVVHVLRHRRLMTRE